MLKRVILLLSLSLLLPGMAKLYAQPNFAGPHGQNSEIVQELRDSAHKQMDCRDCHSPHGWEMKHGINGVTMCGSCHEAAQNDFESDVHRLINLLSPNPEPSCISCHGSHDVQSGSDILSPIHPKNSPMLCGECHQEEQEEFFRGIHHARLIQDNPDTATCTSCHTAHKVGGSDIPWSTIARPNIAQNCGACHIEAKNDFNRSVHAIANSRGSIHSANCIDCHDAHATLGVHEIQSPTETLNLSKHTCAECHESVELTEMHKLSPNVVGDFEESFHGLAGAMGDRRVANCASCHGYHDILPSWDPNSRIHPANLAQTCGECHEGAEGDFARGGIHHPGKGIGHWLVDFVESMYIMMIAGTIGLMMVHNALDFVRQIRDRRKGHPEVTASGKGKTYLRFTLNERIQHWTLAWSFIVLAITGFALKFGWAIPGLAPELNEDIRAGTHRVAATVFMVLGAYHLGYLALTARGRKTVRDVLPKFKKVSDILCCLLSCERMGPPSGSDWKQLVQNVKYNLGKAKEKPKYGRFNYAEKMEYLALIWGGSLMVVTGLILWFDVLFLNRFPYWGMQLATVVHYFEAILATLAILVWHFYFVMISPAVFPLSKAMITGKLSREEMEHEHPLELEEIEREETKDDAETEDTKPSSSEDERT